MSKNNVLELKVGVLGEPGAGRKMLAMRYFTNCYNDGYDPSMPDVYRKMITFHNQQFCVEVWEQGYDDFDALKNRICTERHAFIICVDTSKSFDILSTQIDAWYQRILQCKEAATFAYLLLVGCKSDVACNAMIHQQLQEKATKTLGCEYVATSAKNGTMVQEAFDALYEKCASVLQPAQVQPHEKKCITQ